MEILGFRDLTAGKKIIAENFTNWTSGNEIIDNFIREKQLNYDGSVKAVFEWIPYNEFIDIKEIGKNCFFTAIWKEGTLFYYKDENEWTKTSYEVVTLKFLYDLQNITNELINNVETYLKSDVIFGISQNPDTKVYLLVFNVKYFNCYCEKCGNEYDSREYKWCKQCQTNQLKNDFTNWTSRNYKTDYFIQKMQLKINNYDDTIFEWIPYNEFIIIKELENYTLTIWKKGPLYYNTNDEKLVRKSYERVYLLFLYVNSHEITDEFSKNEIESYLKNDVIFGISQNPDTKVYILVFNDKCFDHYCEKCDNEYDDKKYKWCKQCQINQLKCNFTNWTSGNIKLYDFIQKMQLKINSRHDKIFEWISYNEFIIIEELEKYTLAIWENDNTNDKKFVRKSRERVHLKYLYNSQEITTEFSNEVESYLKNDVIFGISQNPDTEVYLLVFNDEYFKYYCEKCDSEYDRKYKLCKQCQINYLKNNFEDWTSGNEKVDDFIQKMQLKINGRRGEIFEWISYNEFIEIRELGNNVLATAIWKDGPLYYSSVRRSYDREINKNVILKYLCNSQNVSQLFSNEVIYSVEKNYGVTQNPITKDYMLVCKIESCQTDHENKKINDLIQKIKLNINHNSSRSDIMFEWIPYDQFNDIKEIGKGGFSTVYSAIRKDGLLYYKAGCERKSNTNVALKCLNNFDEFINEAKAYPHQNILKIYGISQNPTTKDYIMVLEYAEGGDFNIYLNKKNILFTKCKPSFLNNYADYIICIMGLCKKIDDINETNIFGVMSYIAPEVLKGKPYTQAADIYSFGIIIYVIATGKQPFINYVGNSNPDNRPNSTELKEFIDLFYISLNQKFDKS
ncbi:hypothetical protein RhiirC2_856822 [Rhizophagus irregularis]|uniref:Protein kinase domain-containing protein n=1 Tax=Rhizophagus irregularis TaxID=588596 RepID=A0A2N1MFT4_9GLOM|nr:hypothetical protein RhiirC2_856822 [Rhizophagus irregularis]